jgi:hypothetical protein
MMVLIFTYLIFIVTFPCTEQEGDKIHCYSWGYFLGGEKGLIHAKYGRYGSFFDLHIPVIMYFPFIPAESSSILNDEYLH